MRATKIMKGLENVTYEARLKKKAGWGWWFNLEKRRPRRDMITVL